MAEQWKRIKLGGLWKSTTSTGKEYFGGGFALGTRIEIWPNTNKRSDKDPDLTLYIVEPPPKDGAVPRREHAADPRPTVAEVPPSSVIDDDIPF